MPTVTFALRGDQIGSFSRVSGKGNAENRVVRVEDVEAVGTADELFTVVVEQVKPGVTEFDNGQFVTILDAGGNVVVPRTVVQPNFQQGLGAGDEHLIIKNASVVIDLGGVPTGPATLTYTKDDEVAGPEGDDDGELDFEDFPCFAAGTLIATPTGKVDVASLSVGDLVSTRDSGSVPIAWIGRRGLTLGAGGPGAPILVQPGFLGTDPEGTDVILSPDHRILIRDQACSLLFGAEEVLAPAKALLGLPRIREMRGRRHVEYVTLFTRRHEIVRAGGMEAETLYPGAQAMRRIGPLGRAALLALRPELGHGDVEAAYPPARQLLTTSEAEALCEVLRLKRKIGAPRPATRGRTELRVVR